MERLVLHAWHQLQVEGHAAGCLDGDTHRESDDEIISDGRRVVLCARDERQDEAEVAADPVLSGGVRWCTCRERDCTNEMDQSESPPA
jgi:hypothetical protein